jgi:Fe-S-cluster-containing dehydrogenase component
MPRYAMVIDTRACIGCGDCVVACKVENNLPDGVRWDWIAEATAGTYPHLSTRFFSQRCNQCSDATCVKVCPVQATYHWNDSNIVVVDAGKCIGCRLCIEACPYEARRVQHPDGYIGKCTFCVHRVQHGSEPACVAVCPTRAMHFGLLDDPNSNVSRLLATRRYEVSQPPTSNEPNVFYLR